jgi:hypothetical protein
MLFRRRFRPTPWPVSARTRPPCNAILKRSGVAAPPCKLWPRHEPGVLAPLRWFDWLLFKVGLPHVRLPWPF